MMGATELKISELVEAMERLTPLAAAEELANLTSAFPNYWEGSSEALARAVAERDRLVAERKAQTLAADIQGVQESQGHRDVAAAELATVDEKIAAFSDQERDYFKRANDIARWTDKAAGLIPAHYHLAGDHKLDGYGRTMDVSPEDPQHRPIVPEEHWERVKELRELYIQRACVGQSMASIDSGLRDLVAKNPALAFVK